MAVIVVGQFTYEDGILLGPRDYMQEQGNTLLDRILAGEDTIFNMTKGQSLTLRRRSSFACKPTMRDGLD